MHLLLALLLAATPTAASPAPRWQWPVSGPRVVSGPYVAPATPYGPGHRGIDIDVDQSDRLLYAPADGVVHFSGIVVDRVLMSIEHAGGVLSSYEEVTTTLVAGDPVEKGQVIGQVHATHCQPESRCLHVGVRVGGEYVSPLLFFGGVPRSVLLPTRDAASAAMPRSTPRRARGPRSGRARRPGSSWHPPR